MLTLVAAAALAVPATAGAAAGSATPPPQYTAAAVSKIDRGLLSDIAGSAFVDADGEFHWTNAYASYNSNPANAWARTFTNTDMSAVTAGMGTTTQRVTAPAYYETPGTMCYQLDKAAQHPIPSPQRDDHCDVIGVWVDPHGTWHALLNDEYQFDPWNTAGADATVARKVSTGHHNNRILLATSSDKGRSWKYAGPALTSGWNTDQAIDAKASPGVSYPFGNSGCRLYIDYSAGYFYITYNVKIYKKPGSATLASWTAMARAPISGAMASGTWQKWNDGAWSQPGIGGIDGNVNSIGGLTVSYDPKSDRIAWNGSGPHAEASYELTTVKSDRVIRLGDGSGRTYTANTLAHTIVDDATGKGVPGRSIGYSDPVTGMDVTVRAVDDVYTQGVKTVTGGIHVTQTDPRSGVSSTAQLITNSVFFQDPDTRFIFLPAANNESAISYNAFAGKYRIVGYDGNVYETEDLGDPDSWQVVGLMPEGSNGGYLTSLDNGSLTNQNVTGRSFLTISDLTGRVYEIAQPQGSAGAAVSTEHVPVDTAGDAVRPDAAYTLRVGGQTITTTSAAGGSAWKLVPVPDPRATGSNSGFYRLVEVASGKALQVSGATLVEQRATGAAVTVGALRPDGARMTSTSLGSSGGSDQWYLQRVATRGTSLQGSTTYRLVNRNTALTVQFLNGKLRLEQQDPGNAAQYLTLAAR